MPEGHQRGGGHEAGMAGVAHRATQPRTPSTPERSAHSIPTTNDKKSVLTPRRAMQEGLSRQAIAHRLHHAGVPTLSGNGRWQKGTIGKRLAQGHEPR